MMLIFMFFLAARRKSVRRRRRTCCSPIFQNLQMCADCRSLIHCLLVNLTPSKLHFLHFLLKNFNSCFGQVGQQGGPGSRPLTKLGSASSTRFSNIIITRSLGALRAPTSSWRPFGPLDFVLRALWALRPCDPRHSDWIVC